MSHSLSLSKQDSLIDRKWVSGCRRCGKELDLSAESCPNCYLLSNKQLVRQRLGLKQHTERWIRSNCTVGLLVLVVVGTLLSLQW